MLKANKENLNSEQIQSDFVKRKVATKNVNEKVESRLIILKNKEDEKTKNKKKFINAIASLKSFKMSDDLEKKEKDKMIEEDKKVENEVSKTVQVNKKKSKFQNKRYFENIGFGKKVRKKNKKDRMIKEEKKAESESSEKVKVKKKNSKVKKKKVAIKLPLDKKVKNANDKAKVDVESSNIKRKEENNNKNEVEMSELSKQDDVITDLEERKDVLNEKLDTKNPKATSNSKILFYYF